MLSLTAIAYRTITIRSTGRGNLKSLFLLIHLPALRHGLLFSLHRWGNRLRVVILPEVLTISRCVIDLLKCKYDCGTSGLKAFLWIVPHCLSTTFQALRWVQQPSELSLLCSAAWAPVPVLCFPTTHDLSPPSEPLSFFHHYTALHLLCSLLSVPPSPFSNIKFEHRCHSLPSEKLSPPCSDSPYGLLAHSAWGCLCSRLVCPITMCVLRSWEVVHLIFPEAQALLDNKDWMNE